MKNILVVILFSILTNRASYCQTSRNDISVGKNLLSDTSKIVTPLALVQKQVIGYNARNLNAFLEPYSEDVAVGPRRQQNDEHPVSQTRGAGMPKAGARR